MVYWKNKKYSKKYSAIIRRFKKGDETKYQFVINSRWRGQHVWHSKLQSDLMTCAFEGFIKIAEGEEDPYTAFGVTIPLSEEQLYQKWERDFEEGMKRRERSRQLRNKT